MPAGVRRAILLTSNPNVSCASPHYGVLLHSEFTLRPPNPTPPRFAVHAYSLSKLKELICSHADANRLVVDDKLHSLYFEEYFDDLGARTIVAESKYIDRDFLEDFSE